MKIPKPTNLISPFLNMFQLPCPVCGALRLLVPYEDINV